MLMPGTILLGARHYPEIAPGVAFEKVEPQGPRDDPAGLVREGGMKLVRHGKAAN
jgi:hypothetical protein